MNSVFYRAHADQLLIQYLPQFAHKIFGILVYENLGQYIRKKAAVQKS